IVGDPRLPAAGGKHQMSLETEIGVGHGSLPNDGFIYTNGREGFFPKIRSEFLRAPVPGRAVF
ncbi:MAG TPA: hypothetical protein PK176_14160, partial [Acidobacteriota bacterium]|nr:hypothetical protein [Acidobacteriota bacterium]HQM64449.1 hypothetical protein [Acidobacteriota bacterium]